MDTLRTAARLLSHKVQAFKFRLDQPSSEIKKLTKQGDRYRSSLTFVKTNSDRVEVGWEKLGDIIDFYVFIDKKCVGLVTFEELWDDRLKRLVAVQFQVLPTKVCTPHSSFLPGFQGLGYTSFIYTLALKAGYVLVSEEHTQAAGKLWESLSRKLSTPILFVSREGKVHLEDDDHELKVLTLKKPRTIEESDIKVTKPYKRRKLKLDPVHRLSRQVYKLRMKNPQEKREALLRGRKYRMKNKNALKRRAEFVKQAKKRMAKPIGPKPHRST